MDFPRTPDEITPEWLTRALRGSGVIGDAAVESIKSGNIGDSGGIAGDVNLVEVEYSGSAVQAPKSFVAKFSHPNDELRARIDSVGQYKREVFFYRELAAEVGVATPAAFFTDYDPASGHSIQLLQNLGHLRGPNESGGCSFEDAVAALRSIAEMPAKWWQSPRLKALSWLERIDDPKVAAASQNALEKAFDPFIKIAGDRLPVGLEAVVRSAAGKVLQIRSAVVNHRFTLCHNDFRPLNLFFDDDSAGIQVVVFDWQRVGRASCGSDVSKFIADSFPVELRREYERDLFDEYLDALTGAGIVGYSHDDLMADIRRSYLLQTVNRFTYVGNAGAKMAKTPDGRKRLNEMCERLQAALDWNCEEMIP